MYHLICQPRFEVISTYRNNGSRTDFTSKVHPCNDRFLGCMSSIPVHPERLNRETTGGIRDVLIPPQTHRLKRTRLSKFRHSSDHEVRGPQTTRLLGRSMLKKEMQCLRTDRCVGHFDDHTQVCHTNKCSGPHLRMLPNAIPTNFATSIIIIRACRFRCQIIMPRMLYRLFCNTKPKAPGLLFS